MDTVEPRPNPTGAPHPTRFPETVASRIRARRGRLHLFDSFDAARTALVVVDMQNAFLEPGAPAEAPSARAIVPAINRTAAALRAAGGSVVWIQSAYTTSGPGAWPLYFDWMVSPALSATILAALTEGAHGHSLWPALDVQPGDLRMKKNRYSAFLPGACDLATTLGARGVETVWIAGTLTNVCCESSARDAMMAGFKTVMVSDANAARSDEEHVTTLCNVAQFFGDVRPSDELIPLLR